MLRRMGDLDIDIYIVIVIVGAGIAGLTVSPNATHVLNAIGLQRVLAQIGMRPERGGVKHWQTGESLVEIPRGADMV